MNFLEYLSILVTCSVLIYFFGYVGQIILLKIEEQKLKIERERAIHKHIEKLYEKEAERRKFECQEKFKLIEEANKLEEELKCLKK